MVLIPYTYAILVMLRPAAIVRNLMQEMTKDSYLEKENPFYDVEKTLRESIERDDYKTVEDCLRIVGEELRRIIKSSSFEGSEENRIANKIFSDIGRIINLRGLQDYHVVIMIEELSELTRTAMEKELDFMARVGLSGLGSVVKGATQNKFIWEAVRKAISELQCIVEFAAKKDFVEVAKKGIMALNFIAESLLKRYDRLRVSKKNTMEYEFAVKDISRFLREIGESDNIHEFSRLARDFSEKIDSNIS